VMLSRVTHGSPLRAAAFATAPDPNEQPMAVAWEAGPAVSEPYNGDALGGGGPQAPAGTNRALSDIRSYEFVAWVPLIVLILLFGLWPKLLLSLTTPAVQTLLGALS
jgi:NADH-quinone oxidoreductase subunit M